MRKSRKRTRDYRRRKDIVKKLKIGHTDSENEEIYDGNTIDSLVEGARETLSYPQSNVVNESSAVYDDKMNDPSQFVNELRPDTGVVSSDVGINHGVVQPVNELNPSLDVVTPDIDISINASENETPRPLAVKLRQWAIQNVNNISNEAITGLLKLWREEGYLELPKTAQTFLKTPRSGKDYTVKSMLDSRNKNGKYCYLGIQSALEKMIDPDLYKNDNIDVLINIDGFEIHKKTKFSMWPILITVLADGYSRVIFPVALFYGRGKPKSAKKYLRDFIKESNLLTTDGVEVHGVKYRFKIRGLDCDTPARSFLKCIKGHTGFFSCERCETRRETAYAVTKNKGPNKGNRGNQLFPEINAFKSELTNPS